KSMRPSEIFSSLSGFVGELMRLGSAPKLSAHSSRISELAGGLAGTDASGATVAGALDVASGARALCHMPSAPTAATPASNAPSARLERWDFTLPPSRPVVENVIAAGVFRARDAWYSSHESDATLLK